MRYVDILKVLAVVATALMAFAATASATTLTAPSGTTYTSTIKAENSGALTIDGTVDITCQKSTLEGNVESHGAGIDAGGNLSAFTMTECNRHVHIRFKGGFRIRCCPLRFRLPKLEIQVTITSIFGTTECTFAANESDLGTLTAASSSTGHATMDLEGELPIVEGNFLCGDSAPWTGKYKVTSPTGLTGD